MVSSLDLNVKSRTDVFLNRFFSDIQVDTTYVFSDIQVRCDACMVHGTMFNDLNHITIEKKYYI